MNTLYNYLRVKPICIVCDGATVDGDVILTGKDFDKYIGEFTHVFSLSNCGKKGLTTTIKNCKWYKNLSSIKSFNLKFIYLWNIVLLNKPYVYLTNYNKHKDED